MLASSTTDWLTAAATGVAAIGTVGTLVAALVQLSRQRAASERRLKRGQAELISAWAGERDPRQEDGGPPREERLHAIELLNASAEPVYMAVVHLVYVQGAGGAPKTGRDLEKLSRDQYNNAQHFRRMLSVVPPGRYRTWVTGNWTLMQARVGAELAFTDRAGVHWLRASDGALTEIEQSPAAYYELTPPHDWEIPGEVGGGSPTTGAR